MDLVEGLIKSVLTIGVVALVILAMAALFVIVFTLATSFDKHINQ